MEQRGMDYTHARLVVVGAGAIGGVVGGRLARLGRDVTLVDTNAAHVQAIRERGLRVEAPDGEFTVQVAARQPADVEGAFDVAFVAVRSNDTRVAAEWLGPRLAPDAPVVSLQNGMNPPVLEEYFGPARVIGASIRMLSRRPGLGHVRPAERGQIAVGYMTGETTPALLGVRDLLDAAIPTDVSPNLRGKLWSKLTYTCLSCIGSLAPIPRGDVWRDPVGRRLCVDLLGEVVETGLAAGVTFVPMREYDPLAFRTNEPIAAREQILLDLATAPRGDQRFGGIGDKVERGEQTEVDFTLGFVATVGQQVGVATPVCAALVGLAHALERGERPLDVANYAHLAGAARTAPGGGRDVHLETLIGR